MRAPRVCIVLLLAALAAADSAVSGTSSSSVGDGLVIDTPARLEEETVRSRPERAAARSSINSGSSRVNSGSRGSRRSLGRKGLRQRQATGGPAYGPGGMMPPPGGIPPPPGNNTPGYIPPAGGLPPPGNNTPPGGNPPPNNNNNPPNDAPLSFCRPGNGVVCSDRDYTALLKANPANIDLPADAFSYAGFQPSVTAALAGDGKLDLGSGGSWAGSTKAALQGAVNSNLGTEALNVATDTANTLVSAGLKVVAGVPDKLSLAFDKTDSANNVERKSLKPNFYTVLGQNFGLPFGFALAKDGVFGKR